MLAHSVLKCIFEATFMFISTSSNADISFQVLVFVPLLQEILKCSFYTNMRDLVWSNLRIWNIFLLILCCYYYYYYTVILTAVKCIYWSWVNAFLCECEE